jgi:hypothetical protein
MHAGPSDGDAAFLQAILYGDAAFLQAILYVWALARNRITMMTTSDSLILFSFRTLSTTTCNSFDSKVYKKM